MSTTKQEQALARLARAQARLARAQAMRDALIIEATAQGASLRTVADRTAMSHTAVRRIIIATTSETVVA